MKLAELQNLGGFVPIEPVKVEVSWKHIPEGQEEEKVDTFDVYVRRRSFGSVERLFLSDDDERSKIARFIAESVLLGEEKEKMTYEQAYQLEPSLGKALMDAVNKVNGSKVKSGKK